MGSVLSCCRKSSTIRRIKRRNINFYHIPAAMAHRGGSQYPFLNNFQRFIPPNAYCHPQFVNQMRPQYLPMTNQPPLLFQTPPVSHPPFIQNIPLQFPHLNNEMMMTQQPVPPAPPVPQQLPLLDQAPLLRSSTVPAFTHQVHFKTPLHEPYTDLQFAQPSLVHGFKDEDELLREKDFAHDFAHHQPVQFNEDFNPANLMFMLDNGGLENHEGAHVNNIGDYGYGGGESFGESFGDSFGGSFGNELGQTADIRQNQSSEGLMNFGRGGRGDHIRYHHREQESYDEQSFHHQRLAYPHTNRNNGVGESYFKDGFEF